MKKILLIISFCIFPSLTVFSAERVLTLTLTSNYVFRGDSQTIGKAAVQANYQISEKQDSGFYAGAFTSNVSRGAEVDLFGGYKIPLGKRNKVIVDLGAVEYLYTDTNFAPISHEFYVGMEYELSHLKYFFGENEARYIDLGIGFYSVGDLETLLHFGHAFSQAGNGNGNGNDISASLQKDFGRTRIGLTATHEDKSEKNESNLTVFISIDF